MRPDSHPLREFGQVDDAHPGQPPVERRRVRVRPAGSRRRHDRHIIGAAEIRRASHVAAAASICSCSRSRVVVRILSTMECIQNRDPTQPISSDGRPAFFAINVAYSGSGKTLLSPTETITGSATEMMLRVPGWTLTSLVEVA